MEHENCRHNCSYLPGWKCVVTGEYCTSKCDKFETEEEKLERDKERLKLISIISVAIIALYFGIIKPIEYLQDCQEEERREERRQNIIEQNIKYNKETYGNLSSIYSIGEVLPSNNVLKITKEGNINYICLHYYDAYDINTSHIDARDKDDYIVAWNEKYTKYILQSLKYSKLAQDDEIYSIVYYGKAINKIYPKLIVNFKGSTINNLDDEELSGFIRGKSFKMADKILICSGFASSLTSGTYKASTYRFLTYEEEFSSYEYEIKLK